MSLYLASLEAFFETVDSAVMLGSEIVVLPVGPGATMGAGGLKESRSACPELPPLRQRFSELHFHLAEDVCYAHDHGLKTSVLNQRLKYPC